MSRWLYYYWIKMHAKNHNPFNINKIHALDLKAKGIKKDP